ncbi:MAG: MFS transporter [Vulcanibacillus sp.]
MKRRTFSHSNSLDRNKVILLTISTLFTVAVTLSNTFINVYLWKITNDYILLGWFNFFQYLSIMVTFIVAGRVIKVIDRVILLRVGIGLLLLFYLVALLLGVKVANNSELLGILIGIGQGFYWFSFNQLYFEITEPEDRDFFNGWEGLLTSFAGIVAPFLAGIIIINRVGFAGYKIIFFVSLIVFLLAILTSFFIYKRQSLGGYQITNVIKQTVSDHDWRSIVIAVSAQGGREGLILFLIGLLVYIYSNNEFILGTYSTVVSFVALITYYFVGKFIKRNWRNSSMMIGSIMMAVVVVPLVVNVNYVTLFIYGIGTSIFAPLYFIPLTSKIFDKIGESNNSAKLSGEYIIIREIGLNLGRIVITLIFILSLKKFGVESLKFLLLLSGSLQIVTWYFMKSVVVKKSINLE